MWRLRYRQNKYGAKTTEYKGIYYDSKLEATYARDLDLRKRAGDIKGWERQVRIPLDVNGKHIADYYIDFVLHYPDGRIEYVETKGFETQIWKLKWRLFEALHGNDPMVTLTVQY